MTGREVVLAHVGEGRPSPVPIVALRTKSHNGPLVRVTTDAGYTLTVTPDHEMLVQLRPSNLYYDLFLVRRDDLGCVLGLGNGQMRDLVESTFLYERQKDGAPTVVEKLWLISSHRTLNQAVYSEQLLSIRYGLPVFDVDPRLRRHGLPEDIVERLLGELDTHARAGRLLKDLEMDEARPHFQRKLLSQQDQARMHYLDGAFFEPILARRAGGGRSGWQHVLRVLPLGDGVRFERDRIRHLGPGEPVVESFAQYDALEHRLQFHGRNAFSDVNRRVWLPLRHSFFRWPASYVREGMVLPVHDGASYHEDTVRSVNRVEQGGDVIEPQLESARQVVAGGLVTCAGSPGEARPLPHGPLPQSSTRP